MTRGCVKLKWKTKTPCFHPQNRVSPNTLSRSTDKRFKYAHVKALLFFFSFVKSILKELSIYIFFLFSIFKVFTVDLLPRAVAHIVVP